MHDSIHEEVLKIRDEMIRVRRDLHQYPELAFEEKRTAEVIARYLADLGLPVQTGVAGTGVTSTLSGHSEGKTILIRADMDALPIQEMNEKPYRSKTDGVMHACGHDGHVAAVLGAARVLRQCSGAFSGQIKFVFQPAEEGLAGASEMIRQGVLSEPKVDAALGFHLYNSMPLGQVAFRSGPTMAGADSFVMEIRGRGGHAAMPDEAVDAILISSHVITSLQALVSKETSPHTPLVVHVGTIRGGNAFNVVADRVELRGTVRALDADLQRGMHERVERIVSHIAAAFRGDFSLEYKPLCCPLVNDPAMVRLVREQALVIVGEGNVVESGPIMASDDMAFFLQEVPGCFFYVGAADRDKGGNHPIHHPLFDFDEDAMPIAAEILVKSTLAFLSSPA